MTNSAHRPEFSFFEKNHNGFRDTTIRLPKERNWFTEVKSSKTEAHVPYGPDNDRK